MAIRRDMIRVLATLTVAVGLLSISACVRNPVTGKRQLSLVSEDQEIALGQQAKEEVAQSIGLVDDPELQAYVSEVGMKLARASERPELPWSFQVIDDASVNAFALPGGPIFVTRGLMNHLNSEAELAIVLGHEIGHVTAKHAVSQISQQQLASLGLGIGSILLPEDLRGLGELANAGVGLLFLKYGRDHESQSDELAFRYALEHGYDPREAQDVFRTLGAVGGGEGRLPEWLSTHPDPENRLVAAERRVQQVKDVPFDRLEVGRDAYLQHLDGLTFGEDPRQGYFVGNTFFHPELRFRIDFPEGWKGINQAAAVTAVSPQQDALVQLGLTAAASPEAAANQFFRLPYVRRGDVIAGTLNALPTVAGYFLADLEQGTLGGVVAFVQHGGRTFQIIAYTPAARLGAHDAVMRASVSSFAPLTDPEALSVKPATIAIVTVDPAMSVSDAHRRYSPGADLKTFALMNGVAQDGQFPAGTKIKAVTPGSVPLATRAPAGGRAPACRGRANRAPTPSGGSARGPARCLLRCRRTSAGARAPRHWWSG